LAQAGVTAAPFSAWLDDWSLSSLGSDPAGPWLPLELHARQDDTRLQLRLDSDRPLVLQGDAGFSQKHPQGGGSYYYSHPFLEADGELTIRGQTFPVSGHAWLDREWSSQFLQADQAGWDWFALHLDSGEKLMLFRLRGKAGQADFRHGVLFSPNGERRSFEPAGLSFEVLRQARVAGRRLPMKWRIGLADGERVLEIEALNDEQWMDVDFPYWEGFVRVSGDGPGSSGDGYMELVGYPAAAD
jgi:predicted secreted hydrolase